MESKDMGLLAAALILDYLTLRSKERIIRDYINRKKKAPHRKKKMLLHKKQKV
jgi:hypothetical protein